MKPQFVRGRRTGSSRSWGKIHEIDCGRLDGFRRMTRVHMDWDEDYQPTEREKRLAESCEWVTDWQTPTCGSRCPWCHDCGSALAVLSQAKWAAPPPYQPDPNLITYREGKKPPRNPGLHANRKGSPPDRTA